MTMVKYIEPGSQTFDVSTTQLVKVSSQGLYGNDLSSFIKRAGHKFANEIKNSNWLSGDIPVHLISIGAGEGYGGNRNGDIFLEKACQKYHNTFVKYAKAYRHHSNKDAKKSYGYVKYSTYNEPMKRIELIICLNGTKEAAKRNNGLVADEELDLLEKKSEYPVSMSCRVPNDICNSCSNVAKNRDEYCTSSEEGGHCKRGGVKNNMCKVCEDGHILGVLNEEPLFFDISRVLRPADRIAYVFGKAASCGTNILGGAALAESLGITIPSFLLTEGISNTKVAEQVKIAYELSQIENKLKIHPIDNYSFAFTKEAQEPTTWHDHGGSHSQLWNVLSYEKISMPLEGFLRVVNNSEEDISLSKESVSRHLPGIYTRMVEDNSILDLAQQNPFLPDNYLPNRYMHAWATKKAKDYSLDTRYVKPRALRGALYNTFTSLKSPLCKSASHLASENIARAYALYKLGFLYSLKDRDPDFAQTKELVVRQNYVN